MVIAEVNSKESFEVTGRGTVYIVPWLCLTESEWWDLRGKEIQIDGTLYQIQGIERYAVSKERAYTVHEGKPIAMIVKPL